MDGDDPGVLGALRFFFIGARCSFGMLKRAFIQIRELAELGHSPERNRPLMRKARQDWPG